MRNGYRCYIEALSGVDTARRKLLTNRLCPKIGLFLLLLTIITLSMSSSVFATEWRRVNVLVAYDEEWESTAFWKYAYSAKTLAHIIISEVSDRFYVEFYIDFYPIAYVFWDSDDNPANKDVMMDEAISETEFETGMRISWYEVDVLIAFTDQEIPYPGGHCYGYSDSELGVVLVRHEYPFGVGQATDNVLQHELSHLYLYEPLDEYEDGLDCVMNAFPYYLPWPWGKVPTALTTENWCEDCATTINANRDNWGRVHTPGGPGGDIYMCPYSGDERE